MLKKNFIPNKLLPWIEARKKYHLSHAQIQMARELGLNPKKIGGIAGKREQWHIPLPNYIEELYEKHFKKKIPDEIRSIEVREAEKRKRKALRKANRIEAEENLEC